MPGYAKDTSDKVRRALRFGDWLTITQLSARTGLTTSQTRSAVSRLKKLGELESDRSRPCAYRLIK